MEPPTVAQRIAQRMVACRDQPTPEQSLDMARRVLADALACALAMTRGPRPSGAPGPAAAAALRGVRGPLMATAFGTGSAWAPAAAFINGALLRDSEMSDTWRGPTPGHHSELIPLALALCEARALDASRLLGTIVFGYELHARLCAVARIVGQGRGWHHTTWAVVAAPAVAAMCLDLDAADGAHAIACSASFGLTTNALHHGATTGLRSLVFPLAAQSGAWCALMAGAGLRGPLDAIEAPQGLLQQMVGDDHDLSPLDDWAEPMILRTNLKAYACSFLMHASLHALATLMRRHGLAAAEIESIDVSLTPRPYEVVGRPASQPPATREEADHSLPWCMALLAVRGRLLPGDMQPEALADPRVHALAARVRARVDPALARRHAFEQDWPARVSLRARGRRWQALCVRAPGDHRAPLADAQLRDKFMQLTDGVLPRAQAGRAWRTLMRLDGRTSTRELVALVTPPPRRAASPTRQGARADGP